MTDQPITLPQPIAFIAGAPDKPGSRVSLVLNGKWRSFLIASDQGTRLLELLRENPQNIEAIGELADIQTWVAKRSNGRVTVDDRECLRLDGKLIDYGLTGRVGAIIEQGVPFESLANFIERLSLNPDPTVAEDLYRFMEKGNLPLDPEGYILAFKKVDNNFWSYRAGEDGKVCYEPGTSPSMPREKCDPNRNVTCSRGLHACSYEYLKFYYGGSGKVVIVRIDPQHVTAIPADHNDQKLRCCLMDVVAEIDEQDAANHFQSIVDVRYPAKVNVVEAAVEAMVEARGEEPDPVLNIDFNPEIGFWEVADEASYEDDDGEIQAAPADAVNDRPEDIAEAVIEAGIVYWTLRGTQAGAIAGGDDFDNEYECDDQFADMMPEGLTESEEARIAFVTAYSNAYNEAYQAKAAAEATQAWTVARAEKTGAERGNYHARNDYPHYDNTVDDENRELLIEWIGITEQDLASVEDHPFVLAFDRAARDAYHETFNRLQDGTMDEV